MKLTTIILLFSLIQVSAATFAQKLTMQQSKVSLREIFNQINLQTGYDVIVKSEQLENTKPINVNFKNEDIKAVLDKILPEQNLAYTIADKTIIIKPIEKKKELSFIDNLIARFQAIDIKGKIVDSLGNPLSGATIKIKGTNRVTRTNVNGEFVLGNVEEKAVLVISFLGYESREVEATSDMGSLILKIVNKSLEEVSILSTGYQNIPKERATGSFSQPNMKLYNNKVSPDIISRLEGITSGLVFNSTGLTGDRKPKISIRGRSTIYANDDPLIIVDNFPYDGDIDNINPNDVENITILKDASAASIWGVQAGNGVIVINTKKGKLNQELKVNINGNFGFGEVPNLYYDPNFLDASSYIDLERFLYDNGKYDQDFVQNTPENSISTFIPITPIILLLDKFQKSNGEFLESQLNNEIDLFRNQDVRRDIRKYFYRHSINQQYSLSLNGGNKQNSYFMSSGYDKNSLNQVGNSNNRISINFNDTFRVKNKLELSAALYYVQSNSYRDNTLNQLFTGAGYTTLPPYSKLVDIDGISLPILKQYSQTFVKNATKLGFLDWQFLPVDELRNGYNNTNYKNTDIRVNTGIKYSFIDNLNADFKYQFERSISLNKVLTKGESFYARNFINRFATLNSSGIVSEFNIPIGGILNGGSNIKNSNRFRGQLNYNNTNDRNQINAIAGYEITQVKSEDIGYTFYGYNDELATSGTVNGTESFLLNPGGNSYGTIGGNGVTGGLVDRYLSYFTNAAYTFNRKYTVSGSARTDASNFFGVNSNQKYVPLWSGGLAWNVDKEKFYSISWLPELRIRASYGSQGNLDKSLTAITTFLYLSRAQFTNANYARVSNYGNPDLKWEKTKMLNLGVDFTFKSNKVSGSIEIYTKKGIDLIGFTTLEPTSGLADIKGNYAGTRGKGLDIQIISKNLDSKFRWTTNYLLSWATDKVTAYTGTNITPNGLPGGSRTISPVIGKPVFAVYAFRWAGLNPVTGDPLGYDEQGVKSSNYASLINPISTDELKYFGNARPSAFGGISNNFSYKQFDFFINVSYKFNFFFHRSGINYESLVKQGVGNTEYLNRWQKTGDEFKTNVPSFTYPTNGSRDAFYLNSETMVEKGDHIRIQDISLSYELNNKILRRLPISRFQFYMNVNNLGILWRANDLGIDPDYPNGGIPNPKIWAFGIKTSL